MGTVGPGKAASHFTLALRTAYYAAYGVFYAGFFFHRSLYPRVFSYSYGYALFLVAGALPLLAPAALDLAARRVGPRNVAFALVPASVLLVAVYVVAHLAYDFTTEHRFDPFLQQGPQDLSAQYSVERPPGGLRVLALGGSTTRNRSLPPSERYCAVLEHLLAERFPERRVEVLNAGQDWWSTKHSLINYVTYAHQWQPDVVVVMHAINDLGRSFSHPNFALGPYDDSWSHHYAQAINAARALSFEGSLLKSRLGPLMRAWYSTLRFEDADFPAEHYRSIGPFRDNLRRLASRIRDDGARVVFVTQPSLYKARMSPEELDTLFAGYEFVEGTGFLTARYASTAHHLADLHRRQIARAVLEPAAHRGVEAQVERAHQRLARAGHRRWALPPRKARLGHLPHRPRGQHPLSVRRFHTREDVRCAARVR